MEFFCREESSELYQHRSPRMEDPRVKDHMPRIQHENPACTSTWPGDRDDCYWYDQDDHEHHNHQERTMRPQKQTPRVHHKNSGGPAGDFRETRETTRPKCYAQCTGHHLSRTSFTQVLAGFRATCPRCFRPICWRDADPSMH